jgi:hypothetical protein
MGRGLSKLRKRIFQAVSAEDFVPIRELVTLVHAEGRPDSPRSQAAVSVARSITRLERRGLVYRDVVLSGNRIWVVRKANEQRINQ